jgi:hypothetical protein
MKENFDFYCTVCGKNFGEDVIKLAKHIGRNHDPTRR